MTAEGEAAPGAPEAGTPVSEQAAAEQPAADQFASEAAAADRVTAERVAADRVTADRVAADRVTADRVAADRVTARPAVAEPPASVAAGRVADGIAHLEQAVAAFSEAAGSADVDVAPLAIELLARTLPLCERDEESAWAWQRGLEHPDPVVAAAVRERLRRAFGSDEGTGEASWWEAFVESAVCHSTLPLLANEVFGALDHMYALAAVPLARGGARTRELRDVLAQAVRVPAGYAWGGQLEASFRERFRDATGADSEAFPEQ